MPVQKHTQEWLASAVKQSIIDLNVVSLQDFEPYDRILYGISNSDRRNDGRIRNKLLRRYQHMESGGWWISGVNLLTGEDSQWGQFKADKPYCYVEDTFKGFDPNQSRRQLIKYETPKNVPTEIIALKLSFIDTWNIIRQLSEAAKNSWIERILSCLASIQHQTEFFRELREACVARRYDRIEALLYSNQNSYQQSSDKSSKEIKYLMTSEDRKFWSWLVKTPKIPLIITEGAKKAGSLISAGYITVALPGIYNGYRQPKDRWGNRLGSPYLIPQLKLLAQGGREIAFCFDNDTKPTTVKNVRTAIAKTGTLLKLQGAAVSVIHWTGSEKGVDDLIVSRGNKEFEACYQARSSLSNFKLSALLDIAKYQPLTVNQKYLAESLTPPEQVQLIGIKSPKNTGKTEWLARIVQQLLFEGKPVLIITHRIQLAKALCARFGVDHIEEVKTSSTKGILGYGLCIDSLHLKSQARFDPECWSSAVVILDEAEQVIWHLLDSATCQDNRVEIIENFQRLLKNVVASGGQIYLSDADLSAISLDYVSSLIGSEIKIWVAQNVYQPKQKRKLICYLKSDPRDLIAALIKAIERGEKVFIHTTGQKARSKWGSINLEILLAQKFPHLRIIRIDRDSVAEPGHPAVDCMANLDRVLVNYDIAIASPIIETGVSIDLKNHFNSVWAIAQGVQTVDAVCQTVERLRDDISRHIWITNTAKGNRIGNGSTSVKALLRSQHKLTKANILLLQQASINDFDELEVNFSPESILSWGKRACIVNEGKNSYRESVLIKLQSEGYYLQDYQEADIENGTIIRKEVYEVCANNYLNFRCNVSSAKKVSDRQLEELKYKKVKTQAERLSEKKGLVAMRYGIEVTPELLEKDDRGWYTQLRLRYYLTVGNQYLAQQERRIAYQIVQFES